MAVVERVILADSRIDDLNEGLMEKTRTRKAFTLVELLVTLIVTGILLSALATLAFALSSATAVGDDAAVAQAQLRHATLHILDLIQRCRLICAAPGSDLVLWRADDNGDGRINLEELVYIERGIARDKLRLCSFTSDVNPEVVFSSLGLSTTKGQLIASYDETYKILIPSCTNVAFSMDAAAPMTRHLVVSFELTQDNATHPYEIGATLRAWAGHLLNKAGTDLVMSDDDE